jgi:hypothetical protein
MDLEAAKINDTQTWTLARISMAACFATTSVLLVASLNSSQDNGLPSKLYVRTMQAPNH